MKKCYSLLIFVLFFAAVSGSGQTLKKSELYKAEKKNGQTYDPSIVGEDDEFIYVMAYENKSFWLEKIDKNSLEKVYSAEIALEEDIENSKKEAELSEMIFTGDKFLIFYEYHTKIARKNHDYTLYVKSYNANDGKLINQEELITIEGIEKKRRKGNFDVVKSEDNSKVLLVHSAYYKKLKKTLRKVILLNRDLEVLHEAEDTDSEYNEGAEIPSSSILDNEGTIYSVVYNYSMKKFKLLYFDPKNDYEKNEEFVELANNTGETITINSVALNINAKNELTFTGLYSLKKDLVKNNKGKTKSRLSLDGSFYLALDPKNHEFIRNNLFKFDQSFLDQFRSEKDVKKGKDSQVSADFNNIRVLDSPDGGIYVICEKYAHEYYYNDGGGLIGERILYGDILSMNYSADGVLNWSNRIPKSQVFYWSSVNGLIFSSAGFRVLMAPNPWLSTRHYGYYAGVHEGELVILFNDTPKNIPAENDVNAKRKPLKKPKKSIVKEFTIDIMNGETRETANFDLISNNVILSPKSFYQKNEDGPVYLFGQKAKSYQYFKYQP